MLRKKSCRLMGLTGMISILLIILGGCGNKEDTAYRETIVEYGALSVGKTESGSVNIGTVDQTFDLNMNALERVEISAGASNNGGAGGTMMGAMGGGMGGNAGAGTGGMDMFSQIFSMAGGGNVVSGSSDSELVVEEVCVTIGEQVAQGDVLYILEESGVEELTAELESNVDRAKADLDAVIGDQELTRTTAEYTYQSSVAYGQYADAERENTLKQLQNAVKEKEQALADAKESLASYKAELAQISQEYEKAYQAQVNMEWSRDQVDKFSDVAAYAKYAEDAISAKTIADSLKTEMEQLESRVEQAQSNVTQSEKQLASTKRSLESGTLSAGRTYELRKLAYETAQETYDVTVAYLEDDLETQQGIYEEAKEKWDEFTSHVDGNTVKAKYSGVITQVGLTVGDSLTTGGVVVSLYDVDEVSMTVALDEEDMTDISLGSRANISFTAYPDDIYPAEVTEISDAVTDAGGNTTYEVTATILEKGDTLFQGMTGDITFITKETKEVMYVSNRAIIREGTRSYVKKKDASGNVKKTEVVTGFSDGTNVEILEGLSVGDIVLIESKVSAE